jgi:hypothetical protein
MRYRILQINQFLVFPHQPYESFIPTYVDPTDRTGEQTVRCPQDILRVALVGEINGARIDRDRFFDPLNDHGQNLFQIVCGPDLL